MLMALLFALAALAEECELANMSVGELRITGEKHLKKLIKENDLFLLAATSKHCAHCCKSEPAL